MKRRERVMARQSKVEKTVSWKRKTGDMKDIYYECCDREKLRKRRSQHRNQKKEQERGIDEIKNKTEKLKK